jgi:Zn-dependent protease
MLAFDDSGNRSYKFSVRPDYFRVSARPGGSGMRFSRIELLHILVSVAVLTVAFSISIIGGIGYLSDVGLTAFAYILSASLLAVASGFLLHELSHKLVAQRYGCEAEFRMNPMGLVIGLFTAFFGFLFALPGAVMIAGRIANRENGIISAAGPAVNLIIGGICLVATASFEQDTLLWLIVGIVAFINIWLAFFNLLPLPPLDGSKVVHWNMPAYISLMAVAVAMLAVFHQYIWQVF